MLILFTYACFFLLSWLIDIRALRSEFSTFKAFFVSLPVQRFLLFWTTFLIPIVVVNRFDGSALFPDSEIVKIDVTLVLAGLISFFWAYFLYKLDIYEAELESFQVDEQRALLVQRPAKLKLDLSPKSAILVVSS